MKKNVWIVNHYAGNMFFSEGGRHYWFAKELQALGYEPVVFCCNIKHGTSEMYFEPDTLWQEHLTKQGIPFVYVKSSPYAGNGVRRVKNMLGFAANFCKAAKQYAKKKGRPDVILASSVHPLTVFAGERMARKFKVPCICEVRDLWPESIFAYYPEKRKKVYAKALYSGEKRMYKRADAIVMTWPGGKDYVANRGWLEDIGEEKFHHICNGVDIEEFDSNRDKYPVQDEDLDNHNFFNVVYAGSIRKVNNLKMLVDAAEILQNRGNTRVKLLVWGDGTELEKLRQSVADKHLENIIFKGRVPKQNVPSLLSQSDCTIMHNSSTALDCYGQSQNKFFEYLAAGKPVVMTYSVGYSICAGEGCGIEVQEQNPESIAAALEQISTVSAEEYNRMSMNARSVAGRYDFKVHTARLAEIIEKV